MRSFLITIIILVATSISEARQEPTHLVHGLFDNSDQTHVFYGSLDLDIPQFNIFNSLSINDVGDPSKGKYPVTPFTYDPNNDVAYMAAPNNQNRTILSVINATSGALLSNFSSIPNTIVSLQYDIFQKQLFAHTETDSENVTQVVEIDTASGNVKQILGAIRGAKPTHISSYCPICRKYFLIVLQDQDFVYLAVNTSDGGGISWEAVMNFTPVSMRFDYKTFTMYTAYINHTDDISSLVGIINRTLGGISKVVGTISDDPSLVVTSLSAYDVAENIYYASDVLSWPYSAGVSYVNVNTSQGKWIPLARDRYNSHAWFVKQFVH
ncbi:unnamed protein product [Didymodactylos carnosus]|uniref:Uncharacterized protein n=1 Tax=Didymodactylos carnosus TaxID=1234261 RepID=A0A814CHU3_9BILA|nr:unnamed protein product [Didymodactylos carnosus]CAF3716993.1 unnamed protein product [Didymodactylos carnosus]